MTWLARIMALFPTAILATSLFSVGWAVAASSLLPLLLALVVLYLVPLATFRIHNRRYPLVEGASHLLGGAYSPWWGGHQTQVIFIAFPALEVALRLVPGLFSVWLRAWGSEIGERVYWTPQFRIGDRSLLEVGDDVILGYDVGLSSHLIKRTRKNVLLYVKRISIEAEVFVGAGAIIGPGVVIERGASVDIGAHIYPRTRVKKEERGRQTKANDSRAA